MLASSPTDVSSLLLTLEEISQVISHSHRPRETLSNIVRLIQGRFCTDVCSVYLLGPEAKHMILGATIGLRPESVGSVRMRFDEGLTGLVAERMAPVMVDDAFRHPRFKYFPEAGEDAYHSFLGVPLIEGGTLQGALVVQTVERRCFSVDEVRMLVAVAAQLAPLVGETRLLEWVAAASQGDLLPPVAEAETANTGPWQGIALSPGIGVGEAYLVGPEYDWVVSAETTAADPATEERRLEEAMRAASDELDHQSRHIAELLGEYHGDILQAQLMILQDGTIRQELQGSLLAGHTAEQAVVQVQAKYVTAFQKLAAPYFRDRVHDLKDVFRRVAWQLRPRQSRDDPAAGRFVLVMPEASVMDLFTVDLERLAGVVVEQGSVSCHAAILARSLKIPMVGQIASLPGRLIPGRPLLVDGSRGLVYPDAAAEVLVPASCLDLPASRPILDAPSCECCPGPRVEANINLLCEAGEAMANRADGVGLFRSEFIFAARRNFPTEEEQLRIYRKLLMKFGGRPVTIRTFDLRDGQPGAAGPALAARSRVYDWRLVLESLPLQQIFKEQVRAILRAGAFGPVRMLVPLVSRSELLDLVHDTIEQAREELRVEGLEAGRHVPLGAMIEVAGAIPLIETWAAQVDFFALGTNDLTASCLGLDRDHPIGGARSETLHPGFFHLLRDAVEAARRGRRPVTVCGELAASPEGTVALAALRVDSLSVAVPQLASVRQRLRRPLPATLADQLAHSRTARQMSETLEPWLTE